MSKLIYLFTSLLALITSAFFWQKHKRAQAENQIQEDKAAIRENELKAQRIKAQKTQQAIKENQEARDEATNSTKRDHFSQSDW